MEEKIYINMKKEGLGNSYDVSIVQSNSFHGQIVESDEYGCFEDKTKYVEFVFNKNCACVGNCIHELKSFMENTYVEES